MKEKEGDTMKKSYLIICDDDSAVRDAMRLILGKEYRITFVANGQEAVQAIKKEEPDLLVLDIKMPQINGLEALHKVRKANSQLKILMITGYESTDVAIEAVNSGANDYLTKPFTREGLRGKIEKVLAL